MTAPTQGTLQCPTFYDLHRKAFPTVSAYVILHGSEKVATIAFKYPRDGASRLYAYIHWLGVPMVRGFAVGYGYDKHSAACASAVARLETARKTDIAKGVQMEHWPDFVAFLRALHKDDGNYWHRNLELAGFTVFRAV